MRARQAFAELKALRRVAVAARKLQEALTGTDIGERVYCDLLNDVSETLDCVRRAVRGGRQ